MVKKSELTTEEKLIKLEQYFARLHKRIKDMFEPSFPVAIASGVLAAFSFINGIRISASKKYRPFVRFLNAVIIIMMIGVAAYIAIMELGEMPGIRH